MQYSLSLEMPGFQTQMSDWDFVTPSWDDFESALDNNKEQTLALAIVSLIIGIFGMAANSQIVSFYWSKKKALVPSLYLCLALTDFAVSFTALLHFVGTILLLPGLGLAEETELLAFLAFLYSLTTIIIRMSAFANVVLIVVRTINITRPFYDVSRKKIFISYILVFLILLPLTIYEAIAIWSYNDAFFTKINFIFKPFLGDNAIKDIYYSIEEATKKKSVSYIPEYVTLIVNGAPLILAVLISLCCLAVNAVFLKKTPPGGASKERRKTENQVTVTITILTVTFAICTSTYTIFLAVVTASDSLGFYTTDPTVMQWTYVTSTIFPFICSAFNPIVLIVRSKALKESVRRQVLCLGRENSSQNSDKAPSSLTTRTSEF